MMKITVPRDGAQRNCKRARAYPASRPQKREIPVALVYSFFVEHYVTALTGAVKG